MNWRTLTAVLATALALVMGTVLTVANGHDGTPAVSVLVSQPASHTSALPLTASVGPCVLDSTGVAGQRTVQVSGACTGSLLGSTSCGDATGSVALALQTSAGPGVTFAVIMQFENDPLTAGPQPASLFVEVAGPTGFHRWSDRSATVPVTASGVIDLDGVRLPPEAGTEAAPILLSGSVLCTTSS